MATHHFSPQHYFTTLGNHPPVLRIESGDTVITSNVDAYGKNENDQPVTLRGNPQTGPFHIEGAEIHDTLAVRFDRLYPNREIGYTSTVVAANVVDPDFVSRLPPRHEARWQLDLAAGKATLIDPVTPLGQFTLDLAPMLGCFGVAPAGGQAISTATSGPYGGNMDYRGFVSGVTAYLPVFVPGALFFLGDGHATQGDGEIVGTGIEVSFDAQFTVRVIKGKQIQHPRGENSDYIFTVGNARPLEQALQHATTEMLRWLQEDYGLDSSAASLLLGQCVRYDVGNIYDPAFTMVCRLAKRYLPAPL